ncbi:AC5 [Premna leaf curl virus]|uniref:AC5 n=1 Tax=Premna leaf curl virus TaxID=1198134 RepID=I6RGU0_9GEMI|nr:AC5 [Premna leaf curl virus]AFM44661.1 AC5 [Premna leaf curl virus]
MQNLFPTRWVSPLPRVTSEIQMTLPVWATSCRCSNDWTLHGPSQPFGTSGLLYILYILGFRYMGLLAHILLLFVTRTVGTVARLIPGDSKFSLRRTFEAGVEMTISAGRFDIATCSNNKDQVTYKIVAQRIWSVCIFNKLTVFYGQHTP